MIFCLFLSRGVFWGHWGYFLKDHLFFLKVNLLKKEIMFCLYVYLSDQDCTWYKTFNPWMFTKRTNKYMLMQGFNNLWIRNFLSLFCSRIFLKLSRKSNPCFHSNRILKAQFFSCRLQATTSHIWKFSMKIYWTTWHNLVRSLQYWGYPKPTGDFLAVTLLFPFPVCSKPKMATVGFPLCNTNRSKR